nr:MAG TPA: hypothetical protein [Caudoviricetes sp.]
MQFIELLSTTEKSVFRIRLSFTRGYRPFRRADLLCPSQVGHGNGKIEPPVFENLAIGKPRERQNGRSNRKNLRTISKFSAREKSRFCYSPEVRSRLVENFEIFLLSLTTGHEKRI